MTKNELLEELADLKIHCMELENELDKSKLIELCDLYSSKTLHILKKYLEDNNDK